MYCDFHKSFDKATCKVFVETLVKSESGDIADVCLCGGFENHSVLVRRRMTS